MTYNTTREQARRCKPTRAQRAAIEAAKRKTPRDRRGKFVARTAA